MASLPEAAYRHQLHSTLLLDPGQSVLSPHYQAKRESWENKKREKEQKKTSKIYVPNSSTHQSCRHLN